MIGFEITVKVTWSYLQSFLNYRSVGARRAAWLGTKTSGEFDSHHSDSSIDQKIQISLQDIPRILFRINAFMEPIAGNYRAIDDNRV